MGDEADKDKEVFAARRYQMVAQQIEGRGIHDPAVLKAMRAIPREAFVSEADREFAYDDTPLPIPARQTISQPFVVAYMISALELRPDDRVLEIGAGSGYAAALLSCIVKEVYTVERHRQLVEYARERLAAVGRENVWVKHGDGTLGWPEHAPYDGIIVAAGGPSVPESLREQLGIGGRLIMPVGRDRHHQFLVLVTRQDEETYTQERLSPVAFVPLIGKEGW